MFAPSLLEKKLHLLTPGAVQQHLAQILGKLRKGGAGRKGEMLRKRFEQLLIVDGATVFPRDDGALTQGEVRIGHHKLGIKIFAGSQSPAVGAGALRIVKGE